MAGVAVGDGDKVGSRVAVGVIVSVAVGEIVVKVLVAVAVNTVIAVGPGVDGVACRQAAIRMVIINACGKRSWRNIDFLFQHFHLAYHTITNVS
jgi:hypothetical protein